MNKSWLLAFLLTSAVSQANECTLSKDQASTVSAASLVTLANKCGSKSNDAPYLPPLDGSASERPIFTDQGGVTYQRCHLTGFEVYQDQPGHSRYLKLYRDGKILISSDNNETEALTNRQGYILVTAFFKAMVEAGSCDPDTTASE
jgi:hypothetical protein